MAPKRNVKISTPEKVVSANSEKPLKGRPKRAQPLKVPSLITISIPINKAGLVVPDAEKKVDTNTKIALANEVARSQILKEPIAARVIPPTPKRTRGRKKEVVSEFFNTSAIKEEPVEEIPPTSELVPNDSTIVKKNNRKTPVKNPQPTKGVTRKRVADSTVQKPRIKRQRVTPKSVTIKEDKESTEETVQNDTTTADSTQQLAPKTKSKVPKRKSENTSDVNSNVFNPPAVSSPKKRLVRGKRTCVTSPGKKIQITVEANATETSASVAPTSKPDASNTVDPVPPISRTKPSARRIRSSKKQSTAIKSSAKEAENIKANNIDSRKNSVSSASNLSWTRDISSSSTTTCFTVASNDFFCFDKKIPVLKLVNIDSEIDNHKPKPLDEDSTSDSSSSSDSESSSSDEQSSEVQLGSNSSVKVNSLNLSSSSCKSVTVNEDRNTDKKDYSKAAENLMQALNKIDMEFINWIHDADSITSDLDRIKDSLFDILSNEFYAITHCRNLQEILNTDASYSNKNETDLTTEKVIDSNTVEGNTKNVNNKPKKASECSNNTFEKMRTRSNKTDVKTVVSNEIESNSVKSNRVVNDTVKRKTTESNTAISKTINNDLVRTPVEIDALKSNTVKSDSNKNKTFDNNPVYSNNVIQNKIINKETDNSAIKNNKNESNPTNNMDISAKKVNSIENIVETRKEDEFLKPGTSGFAANMYNNSLSRRRVSESSNSSSDEDMNADCDDDDALSLFAESITGIESSRINTSIISAPVEKQLEEYVPKPIQNNFVPPQNYSYCPTRISDQMKNGVIKTICEKQNADSTSIYKDSNSLPPQETGSIEDSAESNQEFIEKPGPTHSELNIPNHIQKIILMANKYMLRPKESNVIFKGYCFFNLINKCLAPMYSKPCRYSHDIPDDNVIINRLSSLSTDILIKEYMLLRRNDLLMRNYAIFVLFECVQRNLTRIVVEIAYDFIRRNALGVQIDSTLRTAAVEIALLHLNNVDLSICEDLLFLVVPGRSLLCEVFMQVMASTQNFSRFKSVFLSLTYFFVNNDRTFSLEVAELLLERVCILPFDEPVVRALIQIIRLTKQEIFLHSMVENFEKMISVNSDVLDEYLLIKSEVNFEKLARKVADQRPGGQIEQPMLAQPGSMLAQPATVLAQPLGRPMLAQAVEPTNVRPEMREGVPLPPSPDTTHLDNLNKTAEDTAPKITRTIRSFSFTPNTQTAVSPNSSNSEEIIKTPNYNNWRHRSIFQHINRSNYPHGQQMRPPMRMLRPPGRMMRKGYNHRLVTFGGSPTVYPSPGPDI